jgi:hypothetical protein
MLEEAYKKLIADLEKATAKAEAAIDAGRQIDETDVEFAFFLAQTKTLLAFMLFLESTGSDGRLLAPVKNMLGELVDAHFKATGGGAFKPVGETYHLATACAMVTLIVERGGKLDSALNQVGKDTGLDKRKLRNYRDNLIRRRASDVALTMYDTLLRDGRDRLLKAPR